MLHRLKAYKLKNRIIKAYNLFTNSQNTQNLIKPEKVSQKIPKIRLKNEIS